MSQPEEKLDFQIQQTKEAECCPGVQEIVLGVRLVASQRPQSVRISGRFAGIRDVRKVAGPKLLVSGNLPRGGEVNVVVDRSNGRQETEIWSYGAWLSPQKNFLAFQSWYPRMIAPQLRRSLLLIYRLNSDGSKGRAQIQFPPELMGAPTPYLTPVYPQSNAETGSYDLQLDSEYILLSPILWSPDEQRLVFVELRDGQNFLVEVVLDMRQGYAPSRVERMRLRIEDLAIPERLTDELRDSWKERPPKLTILRCEWEGGESVVLHPYPQYWLPERLIIRLSGHQSTLN
jgi:hypothetical protein